MPKSDENFEKMFIFSKLTELFKVVMKFRETQKTMLNNVETQKMVLTFIIKCCIVHYQLGG